MRDMNITVRRRCNKVHCFLDHFCSDIEYAGETSSLDFLLVCTCVCVCVCFCTCV